MERDSCELLEQAKLLASKKGLDPEEVVCPTIETCDGDSCDFLPETIYVSDQRATPVEIFNLRRQETEQLQFDLFGSSFCVDNQVD
jgi:hypothetical protein